VVDVISKSAADPETPMSDITKINPKGIARFQMLAPPFWSRKQNSGTRFRCMQCGIEYAPRKCRVIYHGGQGPPNGGYRVGAECLKCAGPRQTLDTAQTVEHWTDGQALELMLEFIRDQKMGIEFFQFIMSKENGSSEPNPYRRMDP
jgi:hypothetical protein